MLYKVDPMGYFGRVDKISRGPWFEEHYVEEDMLEKYFVYADSGVPMYLLTNNIPHGDRVKLFHLHSAMNRNQKLATFGGMWLSMESILRMSRFKNMAIGWKVLSFVGMSWAYSNIFSFYNSQYYGPICTAFFRKYSQFAQPDMFGISDRKREFYEIDTTQYMNYDFEDLTGDQHANHGPQPVRTTF
jgi:hypothetical protein